MNLHNLIILYRTMVIWFALVWWIGLMILNLFYNLFVQLCLCFATKALFSLDFSFLFYVFAFLSSAYKLFVEIPLTVYKWIKVGTILNHISESTLVNLILHNFLVLFVLNQFNSHYHWDSEVCSFVYYRGRVHCHYWSM